jgi:hypothetical protein
VVASFYEHGTEPQDYTKGRVIRDQLSEYTEKNAATRSDAMLADMARGSHWRNSTAAFCLGQRPALQGRSSSNDS